VPTLGQPHGAPDVNGDYRQWWIFVRQSRGTAPAGPGTGWSAGRLSAGASGTYEVLQAMNCRGGTATFAQIAVHAHQALTLLRSLTVDGLVISCRCGSLDVEPSAQTHWPGHPDPLAKPAGTRQEIWALFCLYQALADLVGEAARHHRVDPDRISFLRARNTARRSVSRIPADFPPHQLLHARERAWTELGRRVHDRPGRSSPRATTRHTHRYPARGDRPPTRRVEHTITLHRVKPLPARTS